MIWVYLFIVTFIGHSLCSLYLFKKSKNKGWALKGFVLGLIAVYLYRKESAAA